MSPLSPGGPLEMLVEAPDARSGCGASARLRRSRSPWERRRPRRRRSARSPAVVRPWQQRWRPRSPAAQRRRRRAAGHSRPDLAAARRRLPRLRPRLPAARRRRPQVADRLRPPLPGLGIRLRSRLQILLGLGTGTRGPACRSIGGGFTRSARRRSRDLGVGLRRLPWPGPAAQSPKPARSARTETPRQIGPARRPRLARPQ